MTVKAALKSIESELTQIKTNKKMSEKNKVDIVGNLITKSPNLNK